MIKKTLLACILMLILVLPAYSCAERQSTEASITVTFGDKKFVNTFEVSWNTEKVYRPYGYGYVDDSWYEYITVSSSPLMDSTRLLKAPFAFKILDVNKVDGSLVTEFTTVIDGVTEHGFMWNAYNTSSLEYKSHGGLLDENDLTPMGILLIPKGIRFYPYCYPSKHAEADAAWGFSSDALYEYVEKYGDWYKTADGTWFSNPSFRELTTEEIDRLFGDANPILYRYGDTAPLIGEVQERLGIPVTYQLDDKTYTELRRYQRDNNLQNLGAIDRKTLDFIGL